MFELTPELFYSLTAVAIMLLVGFPVHEYLHAYAAYRLGDSTARWQGRLTLDPRVHFDPFGGTLLVISALFSSGFFLGFAKPTPVNPMNLRNGRHGEALVAAAGPLSNLVLAAIVALPLRFVIDSPDLLRQVFTNQLYEFLFNVSYFFVLINVSLFVFNLLPVPPLDGWRVLLGLISPRLAYQLRGFEQQYAMIIPFAFLAVILFGGRFIIVPIVDALLDLLLG
jgi:Zn-dependent protease